ncbi:MAG: dihydrolipoyl dehydrogenase [Thermoplasmatota archaeon]
MKEYDVIAIGTGSVMSIIGQILTENQDLNVAVIENNKPGGICLTRGCIPSKMLLYPAEIVSHIRDAKKFGVDVDIKNINFEKIIKRMKDHIQRESQMIGDNLKKSNEIDFYHSNGEFIDDYTLQVNNKKIKGNKILICSGSRPFIPPIEGLDDVRYLTSETLLDIGKLPESIVVIGGGYIAAEYGYFLSMMGAKVTIIGRNTQFVPEEEPEISDVLREKLSSIMEIYTGYEVRKCKNKNGKKKVIGVNSKGEKISVESEEILMATGRRSNSDILKPEKSGIVTDDKGWIKVNRYLRTSKKNIWAMGDAIGKHMFKHVANYEAELVYFNAFKGEKRSVDYHAVPHAIFTYPEVASVGMNEKEAKRNHELLVGYQSYSDTTKGQAMMAEDYFVKVLVDKNDYKILGAHIVGPQASILIQEIVNLMYTSDQNITPIFRGMHIHPSLSEVVERAFFNLHPHAHQH